MQRRTVVLGSFVAFCGVTVAGWTFAYFVTYTCWDGHDMNGHSIGGCSSNMGPIGYLVPIMVGGLVAVLIQRRAG